METSQLLAQNRFLSVHIEGELFGIDIGNIKEILAYCKTTKIPKTPRFMKGVMNLRGNIIPVIDLRARFGLEEIEPDTYTAIVIVTLKGTHIGFVVDKVEEVLNVSSEGISDAPNFGSKISAEFIKNIGIVGDIVLMILNLDALFTQEELSNFESLSV